MDQKERDKIKALILKELMKNSEEIKELIQPKRKHTTYDHNITIKIGPIDRPNKPCIRPGFTTFA